MKNAQSDENVVAVCGCEARVYGPMQGNGRREFKYRRDFSTHGAAVLFAQEYEDTKPAKSYRGAATPV